MNEGHLSELQIAIAGALVLIPRDRLEWIALLAGIEKPWEAKNKTDLADKIARTIYVDGAR